MNRKKAKNIREELDMEIGQEACSGIYRGVMTAVFINKHNYTVTAAGRPFTGEVSEAGIGEFQSELLEEGLAEKCLYERNAFRIVTCDDDVDTLKHTINKIVDFYHQKGFVPCCCSCGELTTDTDYYEINGKRDFICKDCFHKISEDIKTKRVFLGNDTSCLFTGTVGALSGAFLGLVFWMLCSSVGLNSIIPSMLTAAFLCMGYRILGGCVDKKGIAACGIVFVLIFILGQYLGLAHWIYIEYKGSLPISYLDAFVSVYGILTATAETIVDFGSELVTALLFDMIIIIVMLRRFYYRNKRGIIFKKL